MMSNFHQHAAWGRVRRPKNILGADGTVLTSAAATDNTIIDSLIPTDDLTGDITAASVNTTTATITLTFGNSSVPDTALVGESIITRGFHPSIDGRLLPLTAVSSGDNTLSFKVPRDNFSQNLVNSLNLQVRGTCTRQTLDGVLTENARFLHLYLHDSNDAAGGTITVYGYNYAFGRWAILQVPANVDGATQDAATVDAAFAIDDHGRAEMYVIPIYGIDKVYFFSSAADDNTLEFSAAISTF
jgi:hypothetical protein